MKSCPRCGAPVQSHPGRGRPRKWCSSRCRIATKSERDRDRRRSGYGSRVCNWCCQEYCSERCSLEGGRHRAQHGFTDRSLLHYCRCVDCEGAFIRHGAGSGSFTRCDDCRLSGRARLRRKSADRRAAMAAGESIDPDRVADRDRWRCGICGHDVVPAVSFPHPFSRSIDHVIPLSRGGVHIESNVQLAHLRCNMLKSDRLVS